MTHKDTQRLYGLDVDVEAWYKMLYPTVLQLKIWYARERIEALNKAHYLWRDYDNISECERAIKHNRALLSEMI